MVALQKEVTIVMERVYGEYPIQLIIPQVIFMRTIY